MRTIAIGLILTSVFVARLAAQGAAPRVNGLPQIGGPGGGEFADDCPDEGAVLTGLALHVGDDVDAVQMLCLGRDLSRKIDMPFHGGPGGGKLAVLLCPPARPAIIALDVAAEGQVTVIVNNIHIYCGIIGRNPSPPRYPDAVFDGPPFKRSSGPFAPSPAAPVSGHQACQPDEVAIGIHGSSGKWLDAIGLICLAADKVAPPAAPTGKVAGRLTTSSGRVAAPPPREPAKAVGRVNTNATPETYASICDHAASARARNSPAAATLEGLCKAGIAANETRDLTPGPTGAPVSICDAAQLALDRNAIEAADLAAKCQAIGGGQALTSPTDQFAAAGQALAEGDELLSDLRSRQPTGPFQRGFDIGTGASAGQTEWGPGKQRILDSLKPQEQEGFRIAISFALDRNRNAAFAAAGAAIAAADPTVAQARQQDKDVRYWLGFDIASGLFGDPALGGAGHTSTGSGSDAIRNALSAPAQRGFNASVAFHLSRKYQ